MLPGDRLVCAFVEPQRLGLQFKEWLLHVTIVPWFRVEDTSDAIAEGMHEALTTIEPFTATAGDTAYFGPRKRTVRLLVQPTPFTHVEQKVRTYLHKKRAWLVDETTKRHYDFRPHVTEQEQQGLGEGQSFHCDRLYIVEQKGDYKEIVSEVFLDRN